MHEGPYKTRATRDNMDEGPDAGQGQQTNAHGHRLDNLKGKSAIRSVVHEVDKNILQCRP